MKRLLIVLAGAMVLTIGTARAQEPKAHEHEHSQPPAVAEQKADDTGEHKAMCACCADKDKMAAMMKEMMNKEKDKK